jgi:hypothetical protein
MVIYFADVVVGVQLRQLNKKKKKKIEIQY